MTKTIKELIVKIKQEIKLCNSVLSLRTLEDLINKYENELAEKDRKIDLLLTANKQITYSTKSREYNQSKLFKEDFIVHQYCINCRDDYFPFDNRCSTCKWERMINLKDNSKYDKLPSKDVK